VHPGDFASVAGFGDLPIEPMQALTIRLGDHDEELAVLGTGDQYLRQVRKAIGVKAMARNGEIRLEGEAERVDRAARVLEDLREQYRRQRRVTSEDVSEAIAAASATVGTAPDGSPQIQEGSKTVRALSEGQARYIRALQDAPLVFCVGPAGTGKTYLAVASAVAGLRAGTYKKIVLVRPAVEAGERLGFLPGDLEAKINPYLRPLIDAIRDLMAYDQLRRYMANDLIEIAPLAYMRGRTLNDAVIIMDEGQNCTIAQMKMFLTRMGSNARIAVTGDTTQVDLDPGTTNGLSDAVERLKGIRGVSIVRLDKSDIVRHPLVQAIVDAYERPEAVVAARPPEAAEAERTDSPVQEDSHRSDHGSTEPSPE